MLKIIVVNTLSYPSSEASVNRILSYVKGLVTCGNCVDLVSSAYSPVKEGDIDGAHFVNYGKTEGMSVVSLSRALLQIIRRIKTGGYDVIILVTQSAYLILPLQIVSRILGIPIIYEVSEYPFSIMTSGVKSKITAFFHTNISFRLFDGMIVMTNALLDYYSKKSRRGCKFLVAPMTVDVSRFEHIEKNSQFDYRYIAYCGNMSGNKDGVLNLIISFHIAQKSLPNIKLLLIGGASDSQSLEELKNYVAVNRIENVVFWGKVDRKEIPSLLSQADALALARPSSLQAKGGFPTKLGEYLLTGKPVIVTAVGEIPLFLNESNSFIVVPDDNEKFAQKIKEVFEDYQTALIIGQHGRELALDVFNGEVQAKRIDEFLRNFINS